MAAEASWGSIRIPGRSRYGTHKLAGSNGGSQGCLAASEGMIARVAKSRKGKL